MQSNPLSIASFGHYGSIPGFLTSLAIASEGHYGIFSFLEEGLLVHTIQLYEKDTQNPIVQARVELFDKNNLIRLRSGTTDVEGKVFFAGLLPGQYAVRMAKLGVYNFPLGLINVFDDWGTTVFYGEPIVLSTPVLPELCRIHVFVVDFGLVPTPGLKVYVKIISLPQQLNGYLLDWIAKTFVTDNNGYVFFDAARGAKIFVQLPEAGIEQEVLVPDVPSVSLKDLIQYRN